MKAGPTILLFTWSWGKYSSCNCHKLQEPEPDVISKLQGEKCLYLSHTQKNRHRPRFILSFPCAAAGAQQAPAWWHCWARCGCPMFPCPGLLGVGVKCTHCASRCALQLWGQSAWQMDAGRAWKVESSGPGRTIHRWVFCRNSVPSHTGALCLWSAESERTASEPWWTEEDSSAGSIWSDCLAHPASWSAQPCCTSISVVHTVDELLQFIALSVLE